MRPPGWLADQLPSAMVDGDDGVTFLRRYLRIFEDLGDSLLDRVDQLEYLLDVDVAPLEMVRWMGAWLGLVIDPSTEPEAQRDIVRAAGRWQHLRGTREGLTGLVYEVTAGGPTSGPRPPVDDVVLVEDGGGVFLVGSELRFGGTVTVHVASTGTVDEATLESLIAAELPVGAELDLRIGSVPERSAPPWTTGERGGPSVAPADD